MHNVSLTSKHSLPFSAFSLVGVFCITMMVGCDTPATGQATSPTDESVQTDQADKGDDQMNSDSVLRHAVFFSFKEDAAADDVKSIVDAFAELPSQIASIIDFQHGTNNSPEGLDDGFTHCFLLTFRDEAGRAEYLPHPAHKAFGDILRPHMKDVFVIDYWGSATQPQVARPLQHVVFFKFKDNATQEQVEEVEQAFAELPGKIDSIKAFEWGKNNSPEKHDDGFSHCFLVTFDSEEGRETYLPHADHKAFVEVLKPVLDKVRVLDFWDTSE